MQFTMLDVLDKSVLIELGVLTVGDQVGLFIIIFIKPYLYVTFSLVLTALQVSIFAVSYLSFKFLKSLDRYSATYPKDEIIGKRKNGL